MWKHHATNPPIPDRATVHLANQLVVAMVRLLQRRDELVRRFRQVDTAHEDSSTAGFDPENRELAVAFLLGVFVILGAAALTIALA
jgi:hypothetical protein